MARRVLIALVVCSLVGCGLPAPTPVVSQGDAARQVERATGLHLTESEPADRASVSNLVASYSGADGGREVLLLVFDSEAATRAVTDREASSLLLDGAAFRHRNVVVIYRGIDLTIRRAALARALRDL